MKTGRKLVAVVLCAAIAAGAGMSGCSSDPTAQSKEQSGLSSWVTDSPTKQAIEEFVKDVTTQGSEHFIPKEDRVATFDLDGTLMAENPISIVLGAAIYQIQTNLSSDTELVNKTKDFMDNVHSLPKSERPENYYDIQNTITTKAFEGMTPEEVTNTVVDFMKTDHPDFNGLTYSQSFYKPMVEFLEYLRQNEFDVYLVSGSERDIVRGAVKGVIDLPNTHLIGSTITTHPSGATPGQSNYVFQPTDTLRRSASFDETNIKNVKVSNISEAIGKIPVLAFGNSSDDFSMLNYAMSNSKYEHCAFFLDHDDDQREYIYLSDADREKNKQAAEQYGWHYVSIKDEFSQVFLSSDAEKTGNFVSDSSASEMSNAA